MMMLQSKFGFGWYAICREDDGGTDGAFGFNARHSVAVHRPHLPLGDTVYPSVSPLRGHTLLYVNYADVLNSDVSKYYNARSARSIHGGTGMHLMAWMSGMRLSL